MEQLLNLGAYRNHMTTVFVLTILTGMFVVISLLPLVGLWFHVSALVCGALLMPCLLRHRSVSLQPWLKTYLHNWNISEHNDLLADTFLIA